jgi:hypothetical protein
LGAKRKVPSKKAAVTEVVVDSGTGKNLGPKAEVEALGSAEK